MNFQPPSKSLTTRDYIFITVVVILFLAISAGLTFANLSLPNGGGEFLRHWAGARAFTFEHMDPYSGYVPDVVQKLVYENKAVDGEDPYILDTPFHLLLLYLPFSLLSDPTTARAIYTLILEWALFALVILSLRLTEWTAPRWFVVLFFLFAVINFYTFQAILDASPVLLLGLFYAGIILALRYERDELAGALLAASLYFWEAGLPFLLLMAWRSYKQGRMRVLAGFGMLSFILLAASFLVYSNWIIPYLRAGMNALRTDFGFSIISVLENLIPLYGKYLAWGIITLLIIDLGYEWNASLYGDERRFYWVACLSIAMAPLLGFRTEFENLAVLVIPLAFVFAIVYDRWSRIGATLTFLLLLLVLLVPWALYLFVSPLFETISQEMIFLFLPVFTVLGLYWIRWWAIRPPRVWADSLIRKS
ncbi:MAG: hypothetical protein HYU84_06985 [Chloroflexi bacterium]|nr:hypothetical protein [Chloroflexota bacterium]